MSNVLYSVINVADAKELGTSSQVVVQSVQKRSSQPAETLILFLDLPSATAATHADIARGFTDAYLHGVGGVTTALRLAFKVANDRVMTLNRGATRPIQGALACALVGDGNVVIALCGPAIAFARSSEGAFERLNAEQGSTAIGASHAIELTFRNVALRPGDAFVLTGHGSFSGVPDRLIEVCMSKGDPRMVAGYLNANVKQGRMIGAAFAVGDDATPADIVEAAPALAPVAQAERKPAPPPAEPASHRARRAFAGAAAGLAVFGRRFGNAMSKTFSRAKRGAGQAAKSAQRELSSIGDQLLPETAAKPTRAQRSRAVLFGLAAVAVLIPILVAGFVAVGYLQLSGEADRQGQLSALRAQFAAARASNDPATWTKALEMSAAYERVFAPDPQISAAKAQARDSLDKIGNVARIKVNKLLEFDAPSATRKLASASLGLYTLDTASGEAQYHTLSTDRSAIQGKPVPIVGQAGATLPNFRDLAWATTAGNRWGTEGAVFAGNDALAEYSFASGQLASSAAATSTESAMGQVAAVDLFNNQAYVLDNGIGQIWRFRNDGNGQFTRVAPYFRSPYGPLKDGIDLAIDGAVYVLQRNGGVLKYFGSQPNPFSFANLPSDQLTSPVSIGVTGANKDSGNVLIADSKKGGVFVFTKAGEFVRQLRGANDELADAIDLTVDPTSNTVYVLTPKQVYAFKLPN